MIEDGSAQAASINTIQLDSGVTREMLKATRVGDDLHVRIGGTDEQLVVKGFYTQTPAWQDNWLVRDNDGQTSSLADLFSVAPPPQDWLAAENLQIHLSAGPGERYLKTLARYAAKDWPGIEGAVAP